MTGLYIALGVVVITLIWAVATYNVLVRLQDQLANTEDRIQAARRFYNANARDLNTRISVFPSNLIAGMFSVTKEEFFEIENAAAREAPQTDLHTAPQ